MLHAFVGLADAPAGTDPVGARLRVGVSDDRTYDPLGELVLVPGARGWIELRTDLSAYAGWKWSVFYRPERTVWRVVLAADAVAIQLIRRGSHRASTTAMGASAMSTPASSARSATASW